MNLTERIYKVNHTTKQSSRVQSIKKYAPLYLLLTPVLLYYIVFQYLPMFGVLIAFKDYKITRGFMGSRWIGLENFQTFMENKYFWQALINTIYLSFLRIIFSFPAPIIYALLLNEVRMKVSKRIIQTISYLPHFISWVIIGGIMYSLFSSDGVVNLIYRNVFGGNSIPFLSGEEYFRGMFVGSAIWKEIGWGSIIYLAALSGIDVNLYDASVIDGANRLQQLRYITLPSILFVISTMFVLSFSSILSVGFDQILIMINPTNSNVAEVLDYYIYREGVLGNTRYSYVTAIGLVKSIITTVLIFITNWGAKKFDEGGGLW